MKYFLRCSTVLCTFALMTVVSACGQKGKLIMPPRPTAISTPYPVAQPKPDAEEQAEAPAMPASGTPVPEKN